MASSRAFCSVEAWRVRRGRKSEARPTARESDTEAMREKGREFGGKVGGAEPSVEPEGGRAPVANDNRGDVSETGELLMKDAIQKGDRHAVAQIRSGMPLEPRFPGDGVRA